ncbi:putative transcription factor interactor and regulator CCHC(Zn) family [Helianthus annuus]|nr:putative transcription factor interactor and regulator CCHC(Zn) family [Helianthus annuus]KAJ0706954.1 putative transcription factor interactor and regulator CCHC(Zn) family [Helianthus annuus]
MVLSNKKLKQKLRSVLAESLTQSQSQPNQPNQTDSNTHQSFKSLLNSVTQKPKLSKREIKRVKNPSLKETPDQENDGEKKESDGGLKKNNKRKREKVVGDKGVSEKKVVKKKKKKIKKKKVVKKDDEVLKKENGGSEEQDVTEEVQVQVETQTHTSKEDESICTKIYVGGIPYYSTVDDIQSFFEGCGSITDIDCLKFPETGKFNGIAMISFRTEAAAKRALALDGSDMGGLSLKIQPYKATREKKVSDFAPAMLKGYNRIYVGNLSWDMTEDELKKFFSDCTISSVRLGKDKETGEFKGFAHVDFADSLSLTMALKLDQKPLFGRPVRVRCAVPPKSANPGAKVDPTISKNEGNVNDDVARTAKRQTCYDCGEKGHLSSSCPNKKAADVAHTSNITNDVAFDDVEGDNVGDGKLKRRTCYECGEKGHLSSSCPNKKATDVAHTDNGTDDVAFDKYEEVDNVDGKLKRRTCYECGEKGHLSSLCPKKQAAEVAYSVKEANDMEVEKADVAVVGKEVSDNAVSSISEGKLRRRTCYECGERGHLSSLCPKKQAADVANPVKEANDMVVEEVKTTAVVSDGKLKRRNCYECGLKGHVSSMCPNK